MTPQELKRFEKYVQRSLDGCWLWTGAHDWNGYGKFWLKRFQMAHRVSFEHYRGPISPGHEIDHLCCVRPCVNPSHLDAVTRAENVRRQYGISSDGLCRNGHHNWRTQSSGLYCRTCKTDVARKKRHAA